MLTLPQTPSFRLEKKRALVIGASRGIGLAAATALAQAGAEVTVAARSLKELSALCDALEQSGRHAQAVTLDARDRDAIDALFSSHGPFDVVVNSVGANRPAPLTETDDELIDDIIHLNVKVAFSIARAAARTMSEAAIRGSIITISSQMGHVGNPGRTVYSASKHALEGLTKSLAWEVGPAGIRVNTVCPTFIKTDMTRPMFAQPGFEQWVNDQTALNRAGTLDEVMGAVVFLASEASSLVTGSALMLDAGWTAR